MKTSVIFLAGMLMAGVAFGQNQELNEIEVTAPQFQSKMYKSVNDYLNNAVEYPAKSKNAGLQGTEVVQFIVTPTGETTDFTIINSVSSEIDQEVIRVIKVTDGKWKPGTSNGQAVAMEKEVSVAFILHSENEMISMAKQYQQQGNNWMYVKNNPEKALKFYNRGIVLLPSEESLLAARGLCKYQIGDENGAYNDWNRLKTLALRNGSDINLENLAVKSGESEGYNAMMQTIKK
jgi:TonB family protein